MDQGAPELGLPLDVVKELLSPEMIKALSPAEGLEVKPHVFQSVEQEGHWKPSTAFGSTRAFPVPGKRAATAPAAATTPISKRAPRGRAPASKQLAGALGDQTPALNNLYGPLDMATESVLSIHVPKISGIVQYGIYGPLVPVLRRFGVELGGESGLTIEARWVYDGLEIWAGEAGLGGAIGFGSVFGHQASIELSGVPYSNYFPTQYFLTFSGFVNPMGPMFLELKGAVILGADGLRYPVFAECWTRDNRKPPKMIFEYDRGYVLDLS